MKIKMLVLVVLVLALEACMAKAQNNSYVVDVQDFAASGWIADDEEHTWTLASVSTTADADVYVVTVDADVTGTIGANFKVRLKDGGTTKYFGVLSVGAYSGGLTTLYLFGGTDYVLSGTIGEFSYSSARAPFGWPMNPNKWTILFEDNTYISDGTVVDGEYKNQGSYALTAPAGLWNISYITRSQAQGYEESNIGIATVLSTSSLTTSSNDDNFDETRDKFECVGEVEAGKWRGVGGMLRGKMNVELSSDTTFYIKYYPDGLVGSDFIVYVNTSSGTSITFIRAVWGGL